MTRLVVTFQGVAALIALLVGAYDRALLLVAVAIIVIVGDDAAKLRRRVTELEATVKELIEG